MAIRVVGGGGGRGRVQLQGRFSFRVVVLSFPGLAARTIPALYHAFLYSNCLLRALVHNNPFVCPPSPSLRTSTSPFPSRK